MRFRSAGSRRADWAARAVNTGCTSTRRSSRSPSTSRSPRCARPDRMQPTDRVTEITCDVLVCGAGLGGAAAALRAARMGLRVCLTEETGWPGGQITTQGVAAFDEHRYIETFGGTAAYYELRNGIRAYYRGAYRLSAIGETEGPFSPGNAWVSALSFEPRAGAAVLEGIMADRKSTRLNSSHPSISYAVFCIK